MQTKSQVRKALKQALADVSLDQRREESSQLCEQVKTLSCKRLGIFLPLPGEPELCPAYEVHLQRGTTLALPFPNPDGTWSFYLIDSLRPETRGEWGLEYPKQGPEIPAEELEIILVPGIGFTRPGCRLGHGKGIYDRLLAHTKARKIGVCFSCQVVEQLPLENHDVRMNEVLFVKAER